MRKGIQIGQLALAWLVGSLISYFATGFAARLHSSTIQTIVFSFLTVFLSGLVCYQVISLLLNYLKAGKWKQDWIFFLTIIVLGRFVYKTIETSLSFPELLRADEFLIHPDFLPYYGISTVLAAIGIVLAIILPQAESTKARLLNSKGYAFFRSNARGLLLAVMFFIVYMVLALALNRQDFNTNNVFFAADSHSWSLRLADHTGYLFGTRVVHPFPLLLLRPLVNFVSVFFNGDSFHAALFLTALTGSSGVFLAWIFIKNVAGDNTYAFLFSALLGISTTNLMFNSILETYSFSAFFLVLLYVLLQREPLPITGLVISGVMLFGITISNIVQAVLSVFLRMCNIKRLLRYSLLVLAFCFLLNIANKAIYPQSGLLFFDLSEYLGENRFTAEITDLDKFSMRINLISREMFLYSIVAPKPFLNVTSKDDRGEFPKFNFRLATKLSRFVGFGKTAVWIWAGLLALSAAMFGKQLLNEKYSLPNLLALALLGCLGFNFLFHVFYGYEPFLYAANWTYALVFFLAVAIRPYAKKLIIQGGILALIFLLTFNNLSFLYFLMSNLAPYIPIT